jgi:hypothetical protein
MMVCAWLICAGLFEEAKVDRWLFTLAGSNI